MTKLLFRGIKQVDYEEYNSLEKNEKVGFLWFVRKFNENDEFEYSDIFFGSRKYGHAGSEQEQITALSGVVYDIAEELGNLGLEEGQTLGDVLSSITFNLSQKIENVRINDIDGEVVSGVSEISLTATDIPYSGEASGGTSVGEVLDQIIYQINNSVAVVFEQATDETIEAGHIELQLNGSGETYGVMYYQE